MRGWGQHKINAGHFNIFYCQEGTNLDSRKELNRSVCCFHSRFKNFFFWPDAYFDQVPLRQASRYPFSTLLINIHCMHWNCHSTDRTSSPNREKWIWPLTSNGPNGNITVYVLSTNEMGSNYLGSDIVKDRIWTCSLMHDLLIGHTGWPILHFFWNSTGETWCQWAPNMRYTNRSSWWAMDLL